MTIMFPENLRSRLLAKSRAPRGILAERIEHRRKRFSPRLDRQHPTCFGELRSRRLTSHDHRALETHRFEDNERIIHLGKKVGRRQRYHIRTGEEGMDLSCLAHPTYRPESICPSTQPLLHLRGGARFATTCHHQMQGLLAHPERCKNELSSPAELEVARIDNDAAVVGESEARACCRSLSRIERPQGLDTRRDAPETTAFQPCFDEPLFGVPRKHNRAIGEEPSDRLPGFSWSAAHGLYGPNTSQSSRDCPGGRRLRIGGEKKVPAVDTASQKEAREHPTMTREARRKPRNPVAIDPPELSSAERAA